MSVLHRRSFLAGTDLIASACAGPPTAVGASRGAAFFADEAQISSIVYETR